MVEGQDAKASGEALSPIERIAKSLVHLIRLAGISPAEFAALLTRFDKPDLPAGNTELGDVSLEEDAVILATGVLAAWHQDPKYVDDLGDPVPLPFDGESTSLRSLFGQVSGGEDRVPDELITDIVNRLVAHESIQQLPDGQYRALKRTFAVNARGPAMNAVLARLAGFVETISFNARQGGRFERTAKVKSFPAEAVPLVAAALEESGMLFLEQIDSFIEEKREQSSPAQGTRTKEIGVGVYLLERDE